jgi:hypothetical protein
MQTILLGKPEARRPLVRPRNTWKDILKWFLKIGYEHVVWINFTQDRDKWQDLVNMVMDLWVPIAKDFLTR